MNRDNLLFSIIGVLFGYVVAFTFVVYINQTQPVPRAVAAPAGGALAGESSPGDASLPTNEVKDRQRLRSAAQQ
nr:hypothetical protein [Acidobacteriota bacterium]